MTENTALPTAPPPTPAHLLRRARVLYRALNRIERVGFARRHALAPGDRNIVRVEGRLRIVEPRHLDRPADLAEQNRRLVTETCAELGATTFELPSSSPRARIAVLQEDWEPLLAALAAAAGPTSYLQATANHPRTRRRVTLVDHPSVLLPTVATQRVLRVGTWVSDPRSGRVSGPELGCEIERWDRQPDGAYEAARPNTLTSRIRVDESEPTVSPRPLPEVPTSSVFDVEEPIDLVVLWVDGSDPAWQRRMSEARGGDHHATSVAASRYRDNGELRYMLRSVHQFLPWVRNIYLVTDDQVPQWLDAEHPGITLVSHTELFDGTGVTHSFNSHAIAARLHHLAGLSNRFLMMNDDIIIGRPLQPEVFFHSNGISKIYPSRSTLPARGAGTELPHEEARRNAAAMVKATYGREPTQNFQHVPLAMHRDLLHELEGRFGEELARTWRSRFRSVEDVEIGWLHHYSAYLSGRAVPATMRYAYFLLSNPEAWARMATVAARRNYDVLCLQDDETDVDAEAHSAAVDRWLEAYLPQPAPWEKKR